MSSKLKVLETVSSYKVDLLKFKIPNFELNFIQKYKWYKDPKYFILKLEL